MKITYNDKSIFFSIDQIWKTNSHICSATKISPKLIIRITIRNSMLYSLWHLNNVHLHTKNWIINSQLDCNPMKKFLRLIQEKSSKDAASTRLRTQYSEHTGSGSTAWPNHHRRSDCRGPKTQRCSIMKIIKDNTLKHEFCRIIP